MKYAPLGRTGVQVSMLALGTALFGVAPQVGEAERMVERALDLGINYFDCANTYGNRPGFDRPGVPPAAERESAEEILGRALKGHRHDVVVSSKVQEPAGPGPNDRGLSRLHIFNQIERTLRRLGTDHVDLYYAHHPDPATPIEETLRAFEDLIRQGKVRYAALSQFPGWQVVDAMRAADRIGMAAPVVNQVPYNLDMRDAEREIVPACLRHGLSLTVFSPLAGGLLTPAVDQNREFTGVQRWGRKDARFSEKQLAGAAALKAIAQEGGYGMAQLALAWLLARPAVCSAIIGPEAISELEANIGAADLSLPDEVMTAIDAIGR